MNRVGKQIGNPGHDALVALQPWHTVERLRHDQQRKVPATGRRTGMAGMFGAQILSRFNEIMDARLASNPGRLGRSSVRRAFAMAAYRYEYDAETAKRRLAYKPGLERTPREQLQEAAETAATLARFGQESLARAALTEMHEDGWDMHGPRRKTRNILSGATYLFEQTLSIRLDARSG